MTVLLLHAAFTWAMTGLIWFVQIVHYPLFNQVGRSVFVNYETLNTARTTWVVAPLMLGELACSILLWMQPPERIDAGLTLTGIALLTVIWISTATLSVPQHAILSMGFEPQAWTKLVTTNWIRTIAWSARGALALWMLHLVIEK